jgi:Domain of unknown function (DUF1992)
VPFDRLVENRIREAMEDGLFDNLEGQGRPLDLEEYFSVPEELRMAYSVLKSANCVPIEVELMNEVARLDRAIAAATDPAERQSLASLRHTRQMQLRMMLERRPRRARSA